MSTNDYIGAFTETQGDSLHTYWPQIGIVCESVVVDHRGAHSELLQGARVYPRNGQQTTEASTDDCREASTSLKSVANSVPNGFSKRRRIESDKLVDLADDKQSQSSPADTQWLLSAEKREELAQRFICAVPEDWTRAEPMRRILFEEETKTIELACAVAAAYRAQPGMIFPPKEKVFRALQLVAPDKVRVVIVGQDPYLFEGQADGLAFSVSNGVKLPPSLCNILREMGATATLLEQANGDLTTLAQRGVLLLNTALTVERGKPNSHRAPSIDWERFTDAVIESVARGKRGVCFMLWGNAAQRKLSLIENSNGRHLVLTTSHPSPKSANLGFVGCRHFQQCDEWLAARFDADKDNERDCGPIFQPWLKERQL